VGLLALAKVIAASTAITTARDFTAGDFMTAYPRFRVPIGTFALQRISRDRSRWPLLCANRLSTKL
jgi:hypothetical protein